MNKEQRVEAIKQEVTIKRTKKLDRYHKTYTNEYWITKDQLEEMPEEQQKQASIFRVNKTIKKIEVDKV